MDKNIINSKEKALEFLLDFSIGEIMKKSKDGANWENDSFGSACDSFFSVYKVAGNLGVDSQILEKYFSKYIKLNRSSHENYVIYRREKLEESRKLNL